MSDDYRDYLDNFSEEDSSYNTDYDRYAYKKSIPNKNANYNRKRKRRKGLKWRLLDLYHSKIARIVLIAIVILIIIKIIVSAFGVALRTK